jgi:hypothetical protein
MSGFVEYAKSLFLGSVLPVGLETSRLLPDSLLFGTGLLSLITYQTPMMFLFLSVVLSYFAANAISAGADTFFPQDVPPKSADEQCIGGLYSASASRISLLPGIAGVCSGFPASPILILSSFIFYCITSVLQQSDVLAQLGDDYTAKLPIVCVLGALLLIIFMIYLVSFDCYGFLTILFSIGAGGLFGGILSTIFSLVFGQESINLLGLPLFVRNDQSGQPLYICAARQ